MPANIVIQGNVAVCPERAGGIHDALSQKGGQMPSVCKEKILISLMLVFNDNLIAMEWMAFYFQFKV